MDPGSRSQDLFRLAVDLAPAGLIAVDGAGRILLVNREVVRLFGYQREELLGQPVEMLVPQRFRDRHPAFRNDYLLTPEARPMGAGRDLYGLRKDGSEIPVEIGLSPVDTVAGGIILASVVDITSRKRAEERFQLAVEASPSGMVMTDASGTIVLVNREAERLFGYSRDELIGRSVEVLVPERVRATHPTDRARFMATARARPMDAGRELFARHRDGREVPVEIGLTPIRTDSGTFVLSSIVDVSARRQLEDQLRQSKKMEAIGTLAGGIAHDFNNILNAIIGYAEMARSAVEGRAQIESDLSQVLAAAERGRLLVQRILTFSRRREVRRVAADLANPVREALSLLRATLPSTVEIREHFDPTTPQVVLDETEMHQVMLNLTANSAHAMGERGGVVDISIEPFHVTRSFAAARSGLAPGLHVRLTVADTGEGMPREVLDRVFEPFFTTKAPGSGTGLGLSMVHGIVQSQGGAIEVQSVPGEGTTIHVYFPAAPAGAGTGEPVVEAGAIGPAPTPHILYVEDEELLADLGRRQLEGLGYRVTTLTSSLRALEVFRQRPDAFDLVVTDNTMPRMTGMALSAQILAIRPGARILMVSGLADVLDAAAARRLGVHAILRKPHTTRELTDAVRAALGDDQG